jgi:hypothetical protein
MAKGLYVGRGVDPASGKPGGSPLELDPDDLLTHGMIVGMTGSGKTGLAIVMLEELLRQGVPVIAIDPKGDLANLLLLFDKLQPSQFEPWIDAGAARREGKDVKTAAAEAAAAWTKGLADWNLGAADIAALLKTHDSVIYTPGSSAGVALNVLQSLEAPKGSWDAAEEDLRDEIQSIVSGLLTLVKVEADPLQSPPAVFLASLIEHGWRAGKGFSLESLIGEIADPAFDKIGALPLETAFPRKERQKLMNSLNTLLASPSFEAWRKGEPLDVARMLGADAERPRLAVVSTAHLDDGERLFVTALLLDKVKTWMRKQGGTTALRALVYMDEVFGYFPPHPANPPTKRPLLTLLKQARAQGVGVVLATQNPVDLDYKGLANMGTWLVGTLQTQQDRERLAGGLASAGLEGKTAEKLLGRDEEARLPAARRPPQAARARAVALGDVLPARAAHTRGDRAADEGKGEGRGRARGGRAGSGGSGERAGAPASVPPLLPVATRRLDRGAARARQVRGAVQGQRRVGGDDGLAAGRREPARGARGRAVRGRREGGHTGRAGRDPLRRPARLARRQRAEGARARAQVPAAGQAHAGRVPRSRDRPDLAAGRDARGVRRARCERRRRRRRAHPAAEARQEEERPRPARAGGHGTPPGEVDGGRLGGAQQHRAHLRQEAHRHGRLLGSTKNRMEDNAEARLEALRAEVAALEAQLAQASDVDPARFEEQEIAPVRGGVTLLREDLVWIY